jgi:YfiH family protein
MDQVHGNRVVVIDESSALTPTADALVTSSKGVGLAVRSADCLPILVDGNSVVAAIHAGRKGVTNGVISATISRMRELGGEYFRAVIGPAICANCYEVELEMYDEVVSNFPVGATSPQKHALDLAKMAIFELEGAEVAVVHHGICTKESPDFYSYRRNKTTSRQVGVIAI